MRKRLTKKQRKEALAVARAQLVLALQDAGGKPDLIKHAMEWNLVKTREALRHMDSIGALPFQFVGNTTGSHNRDDHADAMKYHASIVDELVKEKVERFKADLALRLTRGG